MSDTDSEWVKGDLNNRHTMMAVVAVVLSFLLHIYMYMSASGLMLAAVQLPSAEALTVPKPAHHFKIRPEPVEEEPVPELAPRTEVGGITSTSRSEDTPRGAPEERIEPRPLPGELFKGENVAMAPPAEAPVRAGWQPRQEVVQIEKQVVRDAMPTHPRYSIPRIDRGPAAPDISVPIERDSDSVASGAAAQAPTTLLSLGTIPGMSGLVRGGGGGGGGGTGMPGARAAREAPRAEVEQKVAETYKDITPYRALDRLLSVDVEIYLPPREPKYGYFRLSIKRAGAEVLPILAKDLILIQDCSASMTEQKLYFCREGLLQSMSLIRPDDRFNIVSFRDKSVACFPAPVAKSAETIEAASQFIQHMEAFGNTDIYASTLEMLKVPRQAGRPVIALLVTDGLPTTGITDSSRIIEEFSRLNRAERSIFTLGTIAGANSYLLDLLSYRNRGDSLIVTKGRWDIPDSIHARMRDVSRPILSDVSLRFAESAKCAVYPAVTSNMYMDRPLVLYGRYDRELTTLLFQVVGRAGDVSCDMVFNTDLKEAAAGDKGIREAWAWQCIYYLIGKHTETHSPIVLREIFETAHQYDLRVPYRADL